MIGSGTCTSRGSSRRATRVRSMSRHTRATTVVSHPRRLSIPPASVRLNRIQASWTASSASLADPSIRYATMRRCARCCSNRSASHSPVAITHRVLSASLRSLHLLLQHRRNYLLRLPEPAPPPPRLERDLDALLRIRLEDIRHLQRHARVVEAHVVLL